MTAMLYACKNCGVVEECDVNASGQRICRECEQDVTGIVTRARSTSRSPPEGESHAQGDIKWRVKGRHNFTVTAFDLYEAGEVAAEKVDNPQTIKELRPANPQYEAV